VLDSENRQLDEVCFSSGPWFFCFLGSEITGETDGRTDVVAPNQILLLETEYLQEVDRLFAEGVRFFSFCVDSIPLP
jgi:hypothetical protein